MSAPELEDAHRRELERVVAAAACVRRIAQGAQTLGLHAVPAQALAAVARWPLATAQELGERLNLPPPKVSDALKTLRDQGLVVDQRDERDRRVRRHRLTAAGADRARRL